MKLALTMIDKWLLAVHYIRFLLMPASFEERGVLFDNKTIVPCGGVGHRGALTVISACKQNIVCFDYIPCRLQ